MFVYVWPWTLSNYMPSIGTKYCLSTEWFSLSNKFMPELKQGSEDYKFPRQLYWLKPNIIMFPVDQQRAQQGWKSCCHNVMMKWSNLLDNQLNSILKGEFICNTRPRVSKTLIDFCHLQLTWRQELAVWATPPLQHLLLDTETWTFKINNDYFVSTEKNRQQRWYSHHRSSVSYIFNTLTNTFFSSHFPNFVSKTLLFLLLLQSRLSWPRHVDSSRLMGNGVC